MSKHATAVVRLAREGWQIRQVDVEQEPQLVAPFQVQSVPTIVVLREGKEVDRVVGALGYEKLKARFDAASKSGTGTPGKGDEQFARGARGEASRGTLANSSSLASSSTPTVRGQSPAPFPMLSAVAVGGLTNDLAGEFSKEPGSDFNTELSLAPSSGPGMTNLAAASPIPPIQSPVSSQAPSQAQSPMPAAMQGSVPVQSAAMQPAGFQPPGIQTRPVPSQLTSSVSPSPASATSDNLQAAERAQMATVRIRIDEPSSLSFGTGTIINVHGQQALVLTCGHLFRDVTPGAKVSVDLYVNGQPMNLPAQVVSFNAKEYDVGLIEFRSPVPISPVTVAPLSAAPKVGDRAFSFGCDKGADPTRRDTQVKRLNRFLGPANVEIHGAPVVGRSGGGLFDAQGRLIGVCNAADEDDDEGIYAALPVIHQHLAALKLEGLMAEQPASPANAVQLAASATPLSIQAPGRAIAGQVAPASQVSPAAHESGQPGYWPDEPSKVAAVASSAASASRVQCIIHDAKGQQSLVTIDRPSDELIALLRQSASR